MLWQQPEAQTVVLGRYSYIPILTAIGAAAILMLMISGALPLSLVGESLFHGSTISR